jgi:hypothetical protein
MEQDVATGEAGPVVLELGGDIGAAIVSAPARFEGHEIEIRRTGEAWDGRHALVRVRQLGSGSVHAAVFESLEQGHWEARLRSRGQGRTGCPFDVDGGRVTHAVLTD